MTEQEWFTCANPRSMLEFLRGQASDRKLRLFACACCRRVWQHLRDGRSRKAVEVAERFAEGLEDAATLQVAHLHALQVAVPNGGFSWDPPFAAAEAAIQRQPTPSPGFCLGGLEYYYPSTFEEVVAESVLRPLDRQKEPGHQAVVLRCLFGNPFRPVTSDPSWLTSDVVALAAGIYEERAFDQLPILADALQDAGCDNEDVLNHLRGDGPHVLGCWALDLVLGKSRSTQGFQVSSGCCGRFTLGSLRLSLSRSYRFWAAFAGADADAVFKWQDKDIPVPDSAFGAASSSLTNRIHRWFH